MYLACTRLGLSPQAVGSVLGRHRTTAARACAIIETKRDDPAIDAILACLERAIDAGSPDDDGRENRP